MNALATILAIAEDDGGGGSIIGIIILVVIGLVATVFGKLKEKAEQEKARREEEFRREAGRQRGASSDAAPPPQRQRTAVDEQAEAQSVIAELFGAKPPQRPPAPPPPQPRVAAPPKPKPKPQVGSGRLGGGVRREVQELTHGLAADEAQRHRRLDNLADHAGHAEAGAAMASGGDEGRTVRIRVDLSRRDEARRAIIYTEIFGKPKSLRADPDPWDQ